MSVHKPARSTALLFLLSLLTVGNAWAQVTRPLPGTGPGRRPGGPPAQPGTAPGTNTAGTQQNNFLPPGIQLVGGVRLDKPAEMPPGLNFVQAVAYDAKKGQLYLIGEHKKELPAFRPEDLAVALRSSSQGFPAVSIEGPLVEGLMTVKYYGGIEKTRFGQVLFEADRLLKSLAMGRDNVTKKYYRPPVRGYESEVQKLKRMGGAQRPKAWHRYWFQPQAVVMTESEDGQALKFETVKIEVKTEYVPALAPGESEPAAEEFAQHFTDHYDEYARAYPIFAELKELAKVAALAQWIRESGIPIKDLGLEKAVIQEVATVEKTPIGFVEVSAILPEGLWKHQMEGGVSLRFWSSSAQEGVPGTEGNPGNWHITRTGTATNLLKSVLKKPTGEALQWLNTYKPTPVTATQQSP